MSLKAKYHYTHFIYPFVVEEKNYINFINYLVKNQKQWKIKVHNYYEDKETYDFFLPYMRKFLFPTLFWDKSYEKQYKLMSDKKKTSSISKLTCATFEYNLESMKTGSFQENNHDDTISFDITSINLICFKQGICFFDIKAEIEETYDEYIEFNKILDFNNIFRNVTPRAVGNKKNIFDIKAKNIDKIENIAIFIKSIVSGFETEDIQKIYYDKMFTYSYVCVDSWNSAEDFENIKNDFYKFQYVMDSKNTAIFNNECNKLKENIYSRWQYSKFGFSIESGVVFVSDKEKYNITRMPYNFERKYFYMFLVAFYQRISLMNFSQDLLKKDKTMVKKLNKNFTKFTHMSWFSQITNSEYGMDIWDNWQKSFKLNELYDEVKKEYTGYYDFINAVGQERLNTIVVFISTISIILSGLAVLLDVLSFDVTWLEPFVIAIMIVAISSYPLYFGLRWIVSKLENKN